MAPHEITDVVTRIVASSTACPASTGVAVTFGGACWTIALVALVAAPPPPAYSLRDGAIDIASAPKMVPSRTRPAATTLSDTGR